MGLQFSHVIHTCRLDSMNCAASIGVRVTVLAQPRPRLGSAARNMKDVAS